MTDVSRAVQCRIFSTTEGVELRFYALGSETPYDRKRCTPDEARKLATSLLQASYMQQSSMTVHVREG